jgi:hypothetical protein
MGGGNWTSQNWTSYHTSSINGKSAKQIYSSNKMQDKYNPAMIAVRESRDNVDHENSTPIILGLDVTGSMNDILEAVANGLGILVEGIYSKLPVSDPQVMFAAIGDAFVDSAPLQVTQFESDIRIAEQLKDLWFEGGGGGNGSESYPLTWLFVKDKVETDNFEKRDKKGFIFTMGDDGWPSRLTKEQVSEFLGISTNEDVDVQSLLEEVSRKWEVFHLCLRQGQTYRDSDLSKWQRLLGERAIPVTDHTKIPEIIISILETVAGKSVDDIVNSWDGSTGIVVNAAISGLSTRSQGTGVVKL